MNAFIIGVKLFSDRHRHRDRGLGKISNDVKIGDSHLVERLGSKVWVQDQLRRDRRCALKLHSNGVHMGLVDVRIGT